MNQVLGSSAGNALELREAIDFLTGKEREPRLGELTLALAAELLCLGGIAGDRASARARAAAVLDDGRAAERFGRMVAAQGGPRDVLREASLPQAPVVLDVLAPRAGFVGAIDVRALGLVVVVLGGGRSRPAAAVDPRVAGCRGARRRCARTRARGRRRGGPGRAGRDHGRDPHRRGRAARASRDPGHRRRRLRARRPGAEWYPFLH
jgi:thymidine phosphorylase